MALLAALLFAVLMAAAPGLSEVDLGAVGGGSGSSPEAAAGTGATETPGTPVWVTDPLTPPLSQMTQP